MVHEHVKSSEQGLTSSTDVQRSSHANNEQTMQAPPITKTVMEQPIVENIIEQNNIEIQKRDVIREIVVQPIIEVERKVVYKYVAMPETQDPWNFVAVRKDTTQQQQTDRIASISSANRSEIWGLSTSGQIYHLVPKQNELQWDLFPTGGKTFRDLSVCSSLLSF
jgi:hypothetical protein